MPVYPPAPTSTLPRRRLPSIQRASVCPCASAPWCRRLTVWPELELELTLGGRFDLFPLVLGTWCWVLGAWCRRLAVHTLTWRAIPTYVAGACAAAGASSLRRLDLDLECLDFRADATFARCTVHATPDSGACPVRFDSFGRLQHTGALVQGRGATSRKYLEDCIASTRVWVSTRDPRRSMAGTCTAAAYPYPAHRHRRRPQSAPASRGSSTTVCSIQYPVCGVRYAVRKLWHLDTLYCVGLGRSHYITCLR